MVQVHLECVHLHFNYKEQRGCIYSLIYSQVGGCISWGGRLNPVWWNDILDGAIQEYLTAAAAIRSALLSLPGAWLPCLCWVHGLVEVACFCPWWEVIWSYSSTVLPEPPLLCFALACSRLQDLLGLHRSPASGDLISLISAGSFILRGN